MRSRKQTPPELNGDHVDDVSTKADSAAVDALAEEAEAEAAEAEAVAAAARARAKALRLRREAEAAKATEAADEPVDEDDVEDAEKSVEDSTGVTEPEAAQVVGDEAETSDVEPAQERRRPRIPLPSWKAVAATVTVLVIAALLAGSGYM